VSYRSVPNSEIDRQSAGDDQQPRPGSRWPIKEEDDKNDGCARDVQCWKPGITPGAVWTIRIRPGAAETKESRDSEDVEDQRRGDDVVEQIAVEVAVDSGHAIVRARQYEKR
jgi:hypothetical protein